jgi:hypothetical protein
MHIGKAVIQGTLALREDRDNLNGGAEWKSAWGSKRIKAGRHGEKAAERCSNNGVQMHQKSYMSSCKAYYIIGETRVRFK